MSEVPTLVKVISVWYYISAVGTLLFSILLLLGGGLIASVSTGAENEALGALGSFLGGSILVAGVLLLAYALITGFSAYGLWAGRNWGRIIAIVLSAIGVLLNGWLIYAIGFGVIASFSLLVNALIGCYLIFSKSVKEAFPSA
ncbi:DUF2127 domain-containing protein [Candidatus Pacearchaeota archaeon]|nr:MAG: DUF2127 domain-containing protein [Candidatus Pacearchaeota archaeon]